MNQLLYAFYEGKERPKAMTHQLARQVSDDELGMLAATLLAGLVPDDLETLVGTLDSALDDLCDCRHVMRRHRFGPCTGLSDNRGRCECQTFIPFDYRKAGRRK